MKITGAKIRNYQFEIGIGIILIGFYITSIIPLALHGPYNPDEGWYLYNAWQTWEGKMPYQDFAFPQPPATLVVHGFFQTFFGPGFYLGRFVNAGISLLAIAAFSAASRRLWGMWAGIFTATLLVASPLWQLHSVSVSTYATASLFLGLELVAIAYRKQWWAGFFAIVAIAARLTIAPAALVLLATPLLTSLNRKTVQQLLKGISIALVLIGLPFAVIAPNKAWINIVGYHTYMRSDIATTNTSHLVKEIIPFLQDVYLPIYQWFWVGVLLAAAIVFPERKKRVFVLILLGASLLNALLHLPAMNSTYDVPLVPLMVVIANSGFAWIVSRIRPTFQQSLVATALVIAIGALLMHTQAFLTYGQGEHEENHINIKRLVRYIETHTSPDEYILTPELYLAVESGRRSLPGTELGRFFYFPQFSDVAAQKRGVLNKELFSQAVESRQAKLILINMTHFWNNVPDLGHQQELIDVIEQAGYHPVAELHQQQPIIEVTQVYELR